MDSSEVFAVTEALDRVDYDTSLLEELVEIFFSEFEVAMVHLRESAANNDAKLFGRTAHSIKGASGNVGARRVSSIAFTLERRGLGGDVSGSQEELGKLSAAADEFRAAFEASRAVGFKST